ncbi:hypothetical protein [Paludisphaera soli]|uniref:hypothetical protein n=1 Tax=Paludisphaera soli TaxID=2712865 RepID=UPI0013EA2A1A|nr:hypothetical protein [Paludisphaera soli]
MEPVSIYAICPACEGHGRVRAGAGQSRTAVCGRCRGKGRVASRDGEAIVELLRLTGLMELKPEE